MKIAYIPIDERPCNVSYVQKIASSSTDVELIMPNLELLGNKKESGDTEGLWTWVKGISSEVDAIILSIDMLIYGGLLPSRLHYLEENIRVVWAERLRALRRDYPKLEIYASNLIMRTPKYSSSDEEPEYYEHWGREIFLRAYLIDKQKREELSQDEQKQLNNMIEILPEEYIKDYETRRQFNLAINLQMLELVHEGVLTFLSIPQDDSAEFGYTAMDQSCVVRKREELRLYSKVHMYPGADEVGATLLSRAYNAWKNLRPKIFPVWSSTLGPQLIPMYEDRPFAESLKAHILASGCQLVDTAESADLILAYNTPGRVMQESWEQNTKDITYTSFRNMLSFVDKIKSFILSGKKVILADSAFANGGDRELITLLDEEKILDKLVSYKGWNTNCNSLGTTICQGVLGMEGDPLIIKKNLIYHLLDDYFYQAEIRMEMVADFLPKYNLSYFDISRLAHLVNQERDKRLLNRFNNLILFSFKNIKVENIATYAPWNRMFECGIVINYKTKEV
ncbi:DUF4127 family protein [Gottfriedia acidiceleris]|uniref:DUF4127 family protein n=1 Tax=Gottfriedia acidiceleris TaxID=371036 RepID=UPI002F263248